MARTSISIAATAALALLAACGEAEQANQAAAQPAGQSAQEYQVQIAAMPQATRNAVFIRAIRDGGYDCQQVESSGFISGTSWRARCEDGSDWVITLADGGTAQVTRGTPAEGIGNEAASNTNAG
jgi:hypothetical protein